MPTIYHSIADLRSALQSSQSQSAKPHRIALVPTMGNLHEGHLELVNIARQQADIVVVSIFVNPTQFGIGEDFDSYPRTLEEDINKLATIHADYVFAPNIDEMYPVLPPSTSVLAGAVTEQLCGQSRPGHFDGVGIIVAKLFNIVQPNVAIFGQKDYQQLAIIKQLVRDLSYPIEIIGAPIVRAPDGLALSSRNQYLSTTERAIAPILHRELQQLAAQLSGAFDEQKLSELVTYTHRRLSDAGFEIDYLDVKTAQLETITHDGSNLEQTAHNAIIVVAAKLGQARLLDNEKLTFTNL
ncbi:pantoate--beta-alanine ligase [Psychrobacter sp. DM4]|uniref:pantoate--beta-alanine ligase n=1 Tax=Psychrobacter sp. DM4 TaxID=3440637 RepID=UPI003F4FE11E